MSRCRFVEEQRAAYPVARLCRLVGVSRSSFYAWRCRPLSARAAANQELLKVILEIDEASRGTYGRVRIHGQLARRGLLVNHKRVARLMRDNGIRGVGGPGAKTRRHAGKHTAPAPDLLNRNFSAQAPNQRWVADITEFGTLQGKLHVAGVLDLYAGRLVGWSLHERRTAELVVDALVMAIRRRRPGPGVIHHADHGSQYTSLALCNAAHDEKVRLSFGRIGTCADNAAMEAFWSIVKRELFHFYGHKVWPDRATAKAAIFEYFEVFYNRERHQARLGHRTPAEYEADWKAA